MSDSKSPGAQWCISCLKLLLNETGLVARRTGQIARN